LGIVSNLEGLVMSLVLPVWQTNLKGLPAALAVRRQARGSSFEIRGKAAGPTPLGKAAAVAVLLAMVALPAFAADPAMEATYSGGTAKIVADTLGTLDTTSPAELIFRYKERGGAPSEVAIPYAKIRSFEPRNDVVRHLGFLPAVAVGLVAARQRKYTVAISYADAGDAIQIAILQTTEIEHRQLKEILRARAPESCLVTEYSSCANKPPVRPAAAPTAMAASR
jgi:hypothetical protein